MLLDEARLIAADERLLDAQNLRYVISAGANLVCSNATVQIE